MRHMISPQEALECVLASASPLSPDEVPLGEVLGLTLAEDVCADRPYPPFARAMMDGYAVRLADAGRTVPVVGEIAAGKRSSHKLADGQAMAILTGAPCPEGAEAVVPQEDVRTGDGNVRLPDAFTPGANIVPAGSECAVGVVVAPCGTTATPLVIANLAAFGRSIVRAVRRPRCAIITTGAEITRVDTQPGEAQIRDSNGPMIESMARQLGLSDVRVRHALDGVPPLLCAAREAASADVVVFTGGVSTGKYDLVPDMLRHIGADIVFHGVTQKPGKPLLFARNKETLYFGLPGNPLACHLGFHRYVVPAIRIMMGQSPDASGDRGRLTDAIASRGDRTMFQLCRTVRGTDGWSVTPLRGHGSADIFAACLANSYLEIAPDAAPIHRGEEVDFTWTEIAR